MTIPNGHTSPRGPPVVSQRRVATPRPIPRSRRPDRRPTRVGLGLRSLTEGCRAPRARIGVQVPGRSPTWAGSMHCWSDWAWRSLGAHNHHSPMAYGPRRCPRMTACVCCSPPGRVYPPLDRVWLCAAAVCGAGKTMAAVNVESTSSTGPCIVSMAITSPARLWRRRCLHDTEGGRIRKCPEYMMPFYHGYLADTALQLWLCPRPRDFSPQNVG